MTEEATNYEVLSDEARVNVTWAGQNGDMAQPVSVDASDADIRMWVTEAVSAGSVQGIAADENADFSDFVVDRFAPSEGRPFALFSIRPKTPFG
tara:strand:- start:4538 stop:4819 length:282 start_codon:yes stop_codon:yes gene_type:complete